jgi:hypothetical protein
MLSAAYFAAKRAKRLTNIEAAKAPEARLVNRARDDEIELKIRIQTRNRHMRSQALFLELINSPNVKIRDTAEQAEAFFTSRGPRFKFQIWKAFIETCALTMCGTILEIPAVRSLEQAMIGLSGAAKVAKNRVDRTIKASILLWTGSNCVK